ncbi:MAG: RnfABCDGE type electron transport complex subunit D [Patescibacteria group bacterium]|nr:RnfABCDGE type electron transport complex subunit D [Patescibacteria group bacterium]MDE1988110.1 RnfABCDGE type electron transport complex subunit D [Patescibacteria group bacterium]MDE2218435.1 RnfABCDGE type electron transport complex subunit D [Patescibacteria group bacterium]
MIKLIDNFLNKITMYRLATYVLSFLFLTALSLSFFKLLPYTPTDLIMSFAVITVVSWVVNVIFAKIFEAPANVESIYITALILVFIITPPLTGDYSQFLPIAAWSSVWAMASKYILAIRKKHIFNPAAFAVALTAFTIGESASWWVGTLCMLPFVAIGGLLIVRKIRRADTVISFFAAALATIFAFGIMNGTNLPSYFYKTFAYSPIVFFAFIMLTEPLTAPPTKMLRLGYGALVGFLFAPAIHIGSLYSTPELALIFGNIFSYLVSPKEKLVLKLKEVVKVAADTFDFIFTGNQKFDFKPGQYMEWTLPHKRPDDRGYRRYFTLASSPTEPDVRIGVKFYPKRSSFKNKMANMNSGEAIIASGRAGDFILPKDRREKMVFIAGGIGVTPFRSMIKFLLDKNEKRAITILYSNKTVADIAYKDIFDAAESRLGIKTVYAITDQSQTPTNPQMRVGFIDKKMITEEIPDYADRIFYVSGPHSMVVAFEDTLKDMGIKKNKIKIDFFPGLA